ncbi:unnamed protein product [Timema podura]|uniref:Uncharacterized protein n=1 Tax=Timema podura TaxID=61482 RepID=A0ABN7P493_TIMPD|nr:unnamed protein product [Timema podura]
MDNLIRSMLARMTRYKQAEFEDEDSSSVGSVQLTEGVSATSTHIRYHSGATLWKTRSLLEKCLLLITAILLLVVFIMGTLLSVTVRNENAMQVLHVGPHTAGLLLTFSIYIDLQSTTKHGFAVT